MLDSTVDKLLFTIAVLLYTALILTIPIILDKVKDDIKVGCNKLNIEGKYYE